MVTCVRNVPVLRAEPLKDLVPALAPKLGPALVQTLARALALVLGLTVVLGNGRPARADQAPAGGAAGRGKSDEAVARNLYREGKELTAAGKLSLALAKYHAAYDTLPTPTLLWPIAELSLQLDQPLEGLDALNRYRQTMTPALMEPGQQLADAERLERRLRERLGRVRLVGGSGTLVALDGKELGVGPIGDTLPVNPGSHRVDSTTEHGTHTLMVEVAAGQELAVNLAAPGSTATTASQPVAGTSPRYRIHPLPAVLFGLAAGAVTAATVLGGLALEKTQSLNQQCPDHICLGQQGSDLAALGDSVTKQRSFSTSAIALWGIGGVLLASSVVLLAIDLHRQRSGHRLFSSLPVIPNLELAASGAQVSSSLLLGGRF